MPGSDANVASSVRRSSHVTAIVASSAADQPLTPIIWMIAQKGSIDSTLTERFRCAASATRRLRSNTRRALASLVTIQKVCVKRQG